MAHPLKLNHSFPSLSLSLSCHWTLFSSSSSQQNPTAVDLNPPKPLLSIELEGHNRFFSSVCSMLVLNPKGSGIRRTSSMRDEDKELKDGEWLKEDDRSTPSKLMNGKQVVAPPSTQSRGTIVRWERFLPVRSLKVLLAEYDDSTRHLVSALLRNCGYEVTAVANGLQAWKILGDLTNHIDLMLTEVSMPTLSGFGLLCKIMNHKTRRNVPVIMMSSNDSMSTVFNCLSKGAVDFLVKPIRKNELKNLWQHVWRRCHSSSGSGSESVARAQKSSKSKTDEDSDKNAGSNDEDNGSIGSNFRDGSDNGSGTQSPWTKHAVEPGSPRPMSPSDQLADPHNRTCAQVIHPKPGTIYNERVHLSTNREHQEPMKSPDNDVIEKNMEIGVLKNSDTKHKSYVTQKVSTNLTGPSVHKSPGSNPKEDIHDYVLELDGCSLVVNPGAKASNPTVITKSSDNQLANGATDNRSCLSKSSESRDTTVDKFKVPSLELSLKRLVSSEEGGTAIIDDRNVLRHSNLSAFSRYNTSASSTRAPTEHGEGCSLLDNSSAAAKWTEHTNNMISNSNAADPTKQGSNGSSSKNDMGSTTKNVTFKEKSSTSMTRCTNPSAVNHFLDGGTQQVMHNKFDDVAAALKTDQPRGRGQHEVRVQHHYHHYHHHHYHVHSTQQQFPSSFDEDKMSLKNAADGSSNASVRAPEGNTAHYSFNGRNSGVNAGSDNRSNAATTGGVVNNESDNGDTETGAGDGNMRSNADQIWLTQREAALNKFRLKRKERNFGKKVRYHTRKRLAEQRPRVRGQFVRQIVYEHTSREADS